MYRMSQLTSEEFLLTLHKTCLAPTTYHSPLQEYKHCQCITYFYFVCYSNKTHLTIHSCLLSAHSLNEVTTARAFWELWHLVSSSLLLILLQSSVRDIQNLLNMIYSNPRPKKEHVKGNSTSHYKHKTFIPHLSMNPQHDPFSFRQLQTKHCNKSGMILATLKHVMLPPRN
jgi:hypothetical protein